MQAVQVFTTASHFGKVAKPPYYEKDLSESLEDLEVQELWVDWVPDLGLELEVEALGVINGDLLSLHQWECLPRMSSWFLLWRKTGTIDTCDEGILKEALSLKRAWGLCGLTV